MSPNYKVPNLRRTLGRNLLINILEVTRTSVSCRYCRTPLIRNERIIRDHLRICASANLVTTANSVQLMTNSTVRNDIIVRSSFDMSTTTTTTTTRSTTANSLQSRTTNKNDIGIGNSIGSSISEAATTVIARKKTSTTTSTKVVAATMPKKRRLDVQKPAKELFKPLQVPRRKLTGPGPSNCSQRVLQALQQQVLGHMHPEIFQLMDEIKSGLRYAFQTTNNLTLAISASGHSGMEAAIGNLLERGENILIVKAGMWGERAADIATRLGIHVDFLVTELGVAFTLDELDEAVKRYRPKAVFVVHSESSTGLKQPLEGIGDIVHKYRGLLIVDTVASLGAEPFFADAWGVDVVYTGSQKVLGAPSGITPISFSSLAEQKIRSRVTPIPVYYWDMTVLGRYWNCFGAENGPRVYHHTISATLIYGLREALAQLAEEGLEASWARHSAVKEKFHEGLQRRGYDFFVKNPQHRLRTVTSIVLPSGVDPTTVIRYVMDKYSVEISGGLGPTVGKLVRIGLMGVNATPGHVDMVLRTLDEGIRYARTQLNSNL